MAFHGITPPFLLIFGASRVKKPITHQRLIDENRSRISQLHGRLEFQLPLSSKPRWSLSSKAFQAPKSRKGQQPTSSSSPIHFSRRWEAVQLRGRVVEHENFLGDIQSSKKCLIFRLKMAIVVGFCISTSC